jgi:hypothetical protein
MNEHASIRRYGERADSKGAHQARALWHRLLLVGATMAFTVLSLLPGEAGNGEPVGAQGLHRTGVCAEEDFDWTISCDDRSEGGVVSCHMRRQGNQGPVDEGLAINSCVDGRVTTSTSQALEIRTEQVTSTDFGEFVCGEENGSDFCVVCDTFNDSPAGPASNCVKIVNAQPPEPANPPSCGAFNIVTEPAGFCQSAELDLQPFFTDPHIGFSIGVNHVDANVKGAKDLVVCGNRSWQCIADPAPLATGAEQVLQPQTHALINTPCCMRLASGAYYCSAKLTTSSTCR